MADSEKKSTDSRFREITRHFKIENAKCVAVLMLLASVLYHGAMHVRFGNDVCRGLLTEGRYEGPTWQPKGCMLHSYAQKDAKHCMHDITYWGGHTHIVFIGDSRIRQLYYEFLELFGEKVGDDTTKVHNDLQYEDKKLGFVVEFLWHPYVNQSMIDVYKRWTQQKPKDQPCVIITGVATWIIKDLNASPRALQTFKENMTMLVPYFDKLASTTTLLWAAQEPVVESLLHPARAMITNQQVDEYNRVAVELVSETSAKIWSSSRLAALGHQEDYVDGLHSGKQAMHWDIQMLFNLHCNNRMNFSDGSCCSSAEATTTVQFATAVFFAICIVLGLLLFALRLCKRPAVASASEDSLPLTTTKDSKESKMSKWDMFSEIVTTLAKLGVIMAYFFLCDRSTFFMKENKHYSHLHFLLPFVYVLIIGFFFTKVSKQTAVLHRDQTDEWKGWMQLVILIYHMSGASKVLVIYMQIRVLVSSYLFMSGFGHFFYFWNKGDYSLYRFSQVMFRMNFLVVVLCFVMNRPYQFYYFVPLVSFWFIIIYVTMAIWPQVTAGSADANKLHYFYMLLKFVIFMVVAALLYSSESTFDMIFLWRPIKALFVSADNTIHEWRFRWWLDRNSTLFGMVFAFILMVTRKYKIIDESGDGPLFRPVISWLLGAAAVFGYGAYTKFTSDCENKPDCNFVHAYTSFVPIVSFVLLRNLPAWLRVRYSTFFAWAGQISLELFISQYHIWLAADTVGALVLVPGFPILNVCVTTFIFVCIAHEIHIITGKLVAYCVPKDWKIIVRNAVGFLIILIPVALAHGAFLA